MKVAVIGTGAYGLAMALMLHKNNEVSVWSENEEKIKEIKRHGKIDSILKDVKIPKDITFSTSYEKVLKDADIVFLMVSAKYIEQVSIDMAPFIKSSTPICIGTKGIIEDSLMLVTDVVRTHLKNKNIAIVSGPSFAIDMAKGEPVGLSIASTSKKTIMMSKAALESDSVKLRATSDMIGVQICGSIKNVIAVAAGILSGLGYSESTRSFLITESLHDIKELIKALGGDPKTILSFAGVGDLLLTCTSSKSRNYSFGVVVAQAKNQKEVEMFLQNNTVEGYFTLKAIRKLVRKRKIKIPVIDLIYDIVVNGKDPSLLSTFLIQKK